ncbi:hypothetical protein [Legionella bozemanae]|uniref:hypothetical protein n=1 Tax=Legionella bozemanae TaxID=447 RepID=UPI0010411537|nr:hypothetical protein [Legionella bozemanae]
MKEKSNRKAQFQASPVGANFYDEHVTMLNAEDLEEIFAYYRKKHGIRLIRNGDFHTYIVEENINRFAAQLEIINNEEFPNYNLLKICEITNAGYISSVTSISPLKDGNWCVELYNQLNSKGFIKDNRLREDLNQEEIRMVENICRNLFSHSREKLKEKREEIRKSLQQNMENCCLTKAQAIAEILDIQKSLGEDEVVGYVFTNNQRGKQGAHFETVIITKNEIIKPVEWAQLPNSALYHNDAGLNSVTFYSPMGDVLSSGMAPYQQVDHSHCGVLCVLYLKKLLQKAGKALFEDSLRIPFYDDENTLQYIFIPPPSIMQYSQSSKFIKFYQMLMGKNMEVSAEQPVPKNLKELLLASEKRALQLGDDGTAKLNRHLFDDFDDFSEKWLQGCEEACEKRDELFNTDDNNSFSLYLAYAAKRLQDEVRSPKEERIELDSTAEKEKEREEVHGNDSRKDTLEKSPPQTEDAIPTFIPKTDHPSTSEIQRQEESSFPLSDEDAELEALKYDLQQYVFTRMSEAGSEDFASHHRTKIIGIKLGYSAEQKIVAANKLIYALDMRDKLEKRSKEMELTATDIGALTTSRLYENVIKKHLELFNSTLDNLPENQNLNKFRHDA